MGITAGLQTLSDTNLRRVLADPPLMWAVMAPGDPQALAEARARAVPRRGLFARLFGGPAPAPRPVDETPLQFADGELADCDLDKAWHGIHYLLTGRADGGAPPLDFLLDGGQAVEGGGEYGARVFTAAQTAEIAAALAPVDEATLRARFNPVEMTRLGIYPSIWDRAPGEDDVLGYCIDYYGLLKNFVQDAAARGFGLVVSLA
jgi:hypothetical protein